MELLEQIKELTTEAAMTLIAAVAAAIAMWIRAMAIRAAAKISALEVETLSQKLTSLKGEEKLSEAVKRMSDRSTMLTRLSRQKAERVVESVLPEVRRESERPRGKP